MNEITVNSGEKACSTNREVEHAKQIILNNTYIHTYIHKDIHTYIYTYAHKHTYTHTYIDT